MLYHNNKYFRESKFETNLFSVLMWATVIFMGIFSILSVYSLILYLIGTKTLFLFTFDSAIVIFLFTMLKYGFKIRIKNKSK
jgi:hypothetical protein